MPNPLGRALRNRRAGHDTLVWARPDLVAPESFVLSSPVFTHEAPIPAAYRGHLFSPDISPALSWTSPPAGTAELVLIVQDPDVPFARPSTHDATAGIDPALGALADDALAEPSPVAGLIHGRGPLGRRGWHGPAPIPSHGPHSYVFQLFAVDTALGLAAGFTIDEAVSAMTGHLLGRARLDGTFEIA